MLLVSPGNCAIGMLDRSLSAHAKLAWYPAIAGMQSRVIGSFWHYRCLMCLGSISGAIERRLVSSSRYSLCADTFAKHFLSIRAIGCPWAGQMARSLGWQCTASLQGTERREEGQKVKEWTRTIANTTSVAVPCVTGNRGQQSMAKSYIALATRGSTTCNQSYHLEANIVTIMTAREAGDAG
jgi:hypothetical protein